MLPIAQEAVNENESTHSKNELRVLDLTGDTRISWDPENEDEVKVAKKAFNKLLKRGFKAFLFTEEDSRGDEAEIFDKNASRYILIPPLTGG